MSFSIQEDARTSNR